MDFLETTAALIILRCDDYLEKNGITDGLLRFPSLQNVILGLNDDDLKEWANADPKEIKSKKKKPASLQEERYMEALSMLGGGDVMQSLLDLSIALFSFPEFGAYLTTYFGYSVNLHLAFLLEGIAFPSADEILKAAEAAKKLMYVDKSRSPLQYAELSFDERTMGFLFGNDSLNPILSGFTLRFRSKSDSKSLHELFIHKEPVKQGSDFLKKKGRILQLSGKGGRRFLTKHIAAKLQKDFLFLNLADFMRDSGKDRFEEVKAALIREALFDDAGICFYGITDSFLRSDRNENDALLQRDLEVLERILFSPVKNAGIPLILCTDTVMPLLTEADDGEYRVLVLNSQPGYEERKMLWDGFSGLYGLKLDSEAFAMRYRLSASEISKVLRSFTERMPGISNVGKAEEELFTKICMQQADSENSNEVGRIIYSDLRLDDVKIKPNVRAVLNDVIAGIRISGLILDGWGLRSNYPYGRSVSLLMTGPPGTGKTMTANALAGELGLPLYQVNLSNVVDKYIGETEKNLEKAFTFAEKTNSVLFFDEADALFGTRSEVHDSKDRYANTEVSYLLQRIESFDGIVIMATNIKANMDSAFMRRIRYVVHYDNPDEELRKQIWQSCLTEGIPHEDIDFDYLASQFDTFTGSMIKTVFLNACAYAAGKGEKLGMAHLVHAVKHELEKASTMAFSRDVLGKYAYLQ